MNTTGFEHPWALLLLLLLPVWHLYRRRHGRRILFSRASVTGALASPAARVLARTPDWLRSAASAALIIALAGPRTGQSTTEIEAEGIAIGIVVDISTSMLAEDFHPQNRLAVAKDEVAKFIRGRQYDRIGLVAFAGEALTQVPLTIDYAVLYRALEQLQTGMLEDGTAIGTAIATAANRLRRAPGESRVMILMTDGENNRGQIDPLTAARAAAAYGIRIYTIGVGSEGVAPIPIARGMFGGYQYANLPVHIDEGLLREIAATTDGQYFRATNEEALDSIYRRIDALEKTAVEVRTYTDYTPRHLPFVYLAALLLVGEWGLLATRWGRVP
ncbi:MAG TPA: VWA domain-containing protein [Longimicrobiales bacterium]|nr:VWA domain-containing protein [Longimicrobiales bacterium]